MRRYVLLSLLALAVCTLWAGWKWKERRDERKGRVIAIDARRFIEKVKRGPLPWMTAQIQEDLTPYAAGISAKQLDELFTPEMCSQYRLVRFKIAQGKVSYATAPHLQHTRRVLCTYTALKKLLSLTKLPDMEFIVTIEDCLEHMPARVAFPILVYAKSGHEARFPLIPDADALAGYNRLRTEVSDCSKRHPWSGKLPQVFWRGQTTGGYYTLDDWRTLPRSIIVNLSLSNPEEVDARFVSKGSIHTAPDFVEMMLAQGLTSPPVQKESHLRYKYLIDIDGNTCTYERLFWLLLSNSVVLKQMTDNVQWYYKALRPWEHYIPVNSDLSDLFEKLEWAKTHDKEAEQMAARATEFVKSNLSQEDVLLYLHAFLQAYAKLYRV